MNHGQDQRYVNLIPPAVIKDNASFTSVEIDTKGFERAADLAIVNLELDITLFKDRGYLGMNFMNYTPVAMAKFNKRSGKLEWNMDYAKDVNDRLTGVLTANGK